MYLFKNNILAIFVTKMLDHNNISNYSDQNEFQKLGVSLTQLFNFFNSPFIPKNAPRNIGLILTLAIFFAVYIWVKGGAPFELKALILETFIFVFLSTNLFPWDELIMSNRLFKPFSSIQFPWRFLSLATIFSSLVLGFILLQNEKDNILHVSSKKIMIFSSLYLTLFLCYCNGVYHAGDNIISFSDTHSINSSVIVGAEYIRLGTEGSTKGIISRYYELSGGLYGLDTDNVSEISREGNNYSFYVKTGNKDDVSATIPLLNYKGYHAYDENRNELKIQDGADYAINISLHKNYDGNIYVDFEDPWYWTLGLWISVISFIGLMYYYFFNGKIEKKVTIPYVKEKNYSNTYN